MSTACPTVNNRPIREVMASSRLPVLPPGTPYLLKAMSNEEIDFRQLASIVEKFPSIAAKLISLANSTWSSPVVRVTSLEMACARLGFFVVRSISVALSIASIFNPRTCPAFDPVHYWADAILTADVSTALANEIDAPGIDVQATRTAGLLHNLGLLWLATWVPAETNRALALAEKEDEPQLPVDTLLEQHCGIGFCEAGAYLAEAWKFPDLLIIALRYQRDPEYIDQEWETANLIGIARSLIGLANEGEGQLVSTAATKRLGITQENQEHILEHIDSRKQEILELAQTLFAG